MSDPTAPRILFVTRYHYTRFTGGAELQCWMMARELARRGWDVHYASEMNNLPSPPILEGVTLHGLPEDPRPPAANRIPMRALMAKLQPDVVFNQVYDYYMRDSMLEAPPKSLTVWWIAADVDGKLLKCLWQLKQSRSWPRFLKMLPLFLVKRYGSAKGRRKAKLVLEQYAGQGEGISFIKHKTAVLHNSHPPVPEALVQKHAGRPRIVWIASIKKWKRPELFLELAARCKDLDAEFVIAGAVQQAHYHQRIDAALKATPNLSWLGHLAPERVGDEFSRSHLMICTSISEGFSNTFIEAWMHGVPVVSLGVDTGYYLRDKGLGVCVRTMDELEQAVRDLIEHTDKRRAMGELARRVAAQDFLLESNADHLEQLFAERGVRLPAKIKA